MSLYVYQGREFDWFPYKDSIRFSIHRWRWSISTLARRKACMRFLEDHCILFDVQRWGALSLIVDKKAFLLMDSISNVSLRYKNAKEGLSQYANREVSLEELHDDILPLIISARLPK